MTKTDKPEFREYLAGMYALFGRELSKALASIWWNALRQFEFRDVKRAMDHHARDPDVGQHLPRPADIVRFLEGGHEERALRAFSLFERALHRFGPYTPLVFDDPRIHAVVSDMGISKFVDATSDEWPFLAAEFRKRYVAYRQAPETWPPYVLGAGNAFHGSAPPVLIGEQSRAQWVLENGNRAQVQAVEAGEALASVMKRVGLDEKTPQQIEKAPDETSVSGGATPLPGSGKSNSGAQAIAQGHSREQSADESDLGQD